jgi:hypothetical protein
VGPSADRLTAQGHHDFLETILPGRLGDVSLFSCEANVVVSAQLSTSTHRENYPAVVERDISRKGHWTSRDNCMASSVAGSNSMDLFLWGHAKKYVYADTRRTVEDLMVKY